MVLSKIIFYLLQDGYRYIYICMYVCICIGTVLGYPSSALCGGYLKGRES